MMPYRDSLAGMCDRREALVRELEILDNAIRQRAALVIPCGGGLSRWQQHRVRRAWKTIRKLGHWDETRCAMYHMEPCSAGGKPCGATPSQERRYWG